MHNPGAYPFYAVFTGNGHANGFNNYIMHSAADVKHLNLAQAGHTRKICVPLMSYDVKNRFEHLSSANPCGYTVPDLLLVEPEITEEKTVNEMAGLLAPASDFVLQNITLHAKVNRAQYIHDVNALKNHIQQGDIYEVNYCMEFFAQNVSLDAFELFKVYNAMAKPPMACYIKYNNLHLISASPERFMQRKGNKLISQPIKGTQKRYTDPIADARSKYILQHDAKERAENIMIVDLVRNDLSRIAQRGTVHVDELCGIHSFETVHHSISTVSCTVKDNCSFEEILHAAFPMGSMTGAPKIRAMQLIEQYEKSKRQWYSGSTGYILPGGDFDLNVVIRSMVYDAEKGYLSFMVGSAITIGCDAEAEYSECMLKAAAMVRALNATIA